MSRAVELGRLVPPPFDIAEGGTGTIDYGDSDSIIIYDFSENRLRAATDSEIVNEIGDVPVARARLADMVNEAATAARASYADSCGIAEVSRRVLNGATFNDSGNGGVTGATFDGSAARTISYNTIGAASTSGSNATGTWPINITGNAGTAGSATEANYADSCGVARRLQTSANGWQIREQPFAGTPRLEFIYNGNIVGYLSSTGDFVVEGNVAAYTPV